jgi:hypothetical protein
VIAHPAGRSDSGASTAVDRIKDSELASVVLMHCLPAREGDDNNAMINVKRL